MKTAGPHARHRPASRRRRLAARGSDGCTAADAFAVLWSALADVIGPTATAALIQRSIKRAVADGSELNDLVISCERFAYTYSLPRSWSAAATVPPASLVRLVEELWPMLVQLTGSVVVRRLREQPVLRRCGLVPEELHR